MKDKKWKEETKLDRINKLTLSLYITMTIFNIAIGIAEQNAAWIICGLLWIVISIIEYSNLKTTKLDEEMINLQEKHIELQENIIDALMNETAVEIDISKIKIPKHFSKPNENKLQEKFKYYRKNNKFESQIVIDTDYNLLDGYTSYLIAKNYNKSSVIAKLKRKRSKENV